MVKTVVSICFGRTQLHDGDSFTARDKLGHVGHYRVEGAAAKQGTIYVTLRAIGPTLEERRRDVIRHNKANRLYPLAEDALDLMEVEIAWFGERKIRKMEETK